MNDSINKLKEAIIKGDYQNAPDLAREAIETGVSPLEVLKKGITDAAAIVGDQFERMEIYLPELMMSGKAMMAGIDVILPRISSSDDVIKGRVVVGTALGDVHEIGKNILKVLLIASGFEVSDLGVNVPTSKFIQEAERINADIIAISALMTSTLGGQKDVIDYLRETGKRDRYIIMVGGGPTNQQWADSIGADGFAESAPDAVREAIRLIEERRG
jgi:5-methyltetrahydrofolate--homocysteine methyltransferase